MNGVQNVVLYYLCTNNWNIILTDETEEFQLWRGKFLLFFFADLKNGAGKTDDKFITTIVVVKKFNARTRIFYVLFDKRAGVFYEI